MFFTPETGVESAARGIQACVENLRRKFPKAAIVVVKILPAHQPGNRFYEDIRKTNAAFDQLSPGHQPAVTVMDLTSDFTNADGSLHKEFFTPDNVHLSSAGYDHYAQRLKPVLNALISGQPVPVEALAPKPAPTPKTGSSAKKSEVRATSRLMVESKSVLAYPYGPYNEGKLDPQQTGWPLTEAELAWVSKVEYSRKPGHEAQKHLPEFWPVTPTAAHWAKPNESEGNAWIDHHDRILEQVRSIKGGVDVALIGDSITQHLGGGFDGSAFHPSWGKHFGDLKTANLGIGGDRVENILWRLDHGALDGVKVKVVVLLIGTNNAPLVEANGVPADQVAHGIALCVRNLRARLPQTEFIVVDILPAGKPGDGVHKSVQKINASLKTLKIDADDKVHSIDLWNEFTQADGSLKLSAYSGDRLHLSPEGYEIFASRLKPLIYKLVQTAN